MMGQNTHGVLEELIAAVKCKHGWSFTWERDHGSYMRLIILVEGKDARGTMSGDSTMRVAHYFPVPEASYNRATWRRWIFECCRKVEDHELGEWFTDGNERPFAPLHGPGEDPYMTHEFRDVVDAHTRQDGSHG